ncbi:tetratricopeptide repeat protein [Stigmatella hybrida]|uniref:tetratricopeptide repeat protein n=1 Tax=Stigmatella hybrida TaxID=394097 RepID=UPI001CDAA21B|nr:tetratricopeptide repeat protein [Stigmatella hybrida]
MRRWDARWKLCGVVSGLLLLVLPLVVLAQGKDTAQSHIDAARRFYEELEYERAMEELDRAQRRARTQDEFSSILLYEGVILAELGRMEEAAAAFQASLNLLPGATLPLVVSPKIQKQFEAARQEAQRDLARVTPSLPPAPAEDKPEPSPAWVASPPSAPVQAPPALASTAPAPASAAPASAVEAVLQQPNSSERNALARRLADF